jgi:XTP/dITP diphosphohydrolase
LTTHTVVNVVTPPIRAARAPAAPPYVSAAPYVSLIRVPLLLATRNAHKLREFERLLPTMELDPLPDGVESPPEDGETYADNALIKARAAAAATGRPAIADDSGIEADALEGRPGVKTARYAGAAATDEENLARFEAEVPPGTPLRYVCVIAHVEPTGEERLFYGHCDGTMATRRAGTKGFGYDPVFVPKGEQRTMAELADAEKDAISHRGHAARALGEWLGT